MRYWQATAEGILVHCRISPRAKGDALGAVREGRLEVRVAAPPVEGAANERLLRLLAAAAGVGRGRMAIVRGAKGRLKTVLIRGLDRPPPGFPEP
ncbi:MAG: hypothetical protein KatS3mg124_1381 [Porticoccaceae bacterium]|nr:MAG: hypothetical protein KatS3mg124_1381 [Porticoccaceae bacterium]